MAIDASSSGSATGPTIQPSTTPADPVATPDTSTDPADTTEAGTQSATDTTQLAGDSKEGQQLTDFLNYLKQNSTAAGTDGKFSYAEFNTLRTETPAPPPSVLAIDESTFNTLAGCDAAPADGLLDPASAALGAASANAGVAPIDPAIAQANDFLIAQISQYGNPLPSDYLIHALAADGQIANPAQVTDAEQAAVKDLQTRLAQQGYDALSPEEQAWVQQAAGTMLLADASFASSRPPASGPSTEQLAGAIDTLSSRLAYEAGLNLPPPVDPKNFDYQSLLAGGTDTDQFSLFIYNSVANQIKADTQGGLGQTDHVTTVTVPYLRKDEERAVSDWGNFSGDSGGEQQRLSEEQNNFVAQWVTANGPITPDNQQALLDELNTQFGPLEDSWYFAIQQVPNAWSGQQENVGLLTQAEHMAYREWNPDGTPQIYAPSHLATQLANQLAAGYETFKAALATLADSGAFAVMDFLEGSNFDMANDFVGTNGLGLLAGLTPDSPEWDACAQWNNDNGHEGRGAVPDEMRQSAIDAARELVKPEQQANLASLVNDDRQLGLEDARNWLAKQTPEALRTGAGSPLMRAAGDAISALNNPTAWAVMDYLEGEGYSMDTDYFGVNGLQKLSQLTPDSPEWDACAQWNNDNGDEDRGSVPHENRQGLIDAAKELLKPEQIGTLTSLQDENSCFNSETWGNWLNDHPALGTFSPWLSHLASASENLYQPITVDRAHLGGAGGFFANLFSLGIAGFAHTASHRPEFSDTQAFVLDQLKFFGRSTEVLDTAMNTARDEWKDALISEGILTFALLPLAFIPVGGTVASTAARIGSAIGRGLGGALEGLVGAATRAAAPFLQNVLDPLSLLDLGRWAANGGVTQLIGACTTAVTHIFGESSSVLTPLTRLMQRASETTNPAELLPLARETRAQIEAIPQASRTAEQQAVLDQLVTTEAHLEAAAQTAQRLDAAAAPPRLDELASVTLGETATLSLTPARAARLEWQGNFAPITLTGTDGETITATVLRTPDGKYLLGRLSADKNSFMLMRADGRPYGPVLGVADDGSYQVVSNPAYRSDDRMTQPTGRDGKPKSHLNEAGNLVPANPGGKASISDHVRGHQTVRKADSPYTSFSTANVEGTAFGNGEIVSVNLERLEADIAAGVLPQGNVTIVKTEEILAAIKTDLVARIRDTLGAVAEETDAAIWNMAKTGELQFSELPKKVAKALADDVRKFTEAYENVQRANEVLIQGKVPAEYLELFS